jgi:hypothetical protein
VSHPPIKFRYNAALAVAGVIATLGGVPLLGASPFFAFVLLIPISVAVWGWRAGTDADERGVVVRALFGKRLIPWTQIEELVPDGRKVQARLANGRVITLPAVMAADLPRLVQASGNELDSPAAHEAEDHAAQDEPADDHSAAGN